MFEVKYLARGVIHIDLSDWLTAKTVNKILMLNGDILVGEQWSFSNELQKLGFSHDFINKYSKYHIDTMFNLSASSTDSMMLHDASSICTWVAFLCLSLSECWMGWQTHHFVVVKNNNK